MAAISLGVPENAPDTRGSKNQMDMITTTIGGLPFCPDKLFFDKLWPIVCSTCKTKMNFISQVDTWLWGTWPHDIGDSFIMQAMHLLFEQVYAPIGDCNRSLYIFGSNICMLQYVSLCGLQSLCFTCEPFL